MVDKVLLLKAQRQENLDCVGEMQIVVTVCLSTIIKA